MKIPCFGVCKEFTVVFHQYILYNCTIVHCPFLSSLSFLFLSVVLLPSSLLSFPFLSIILSFLSLSSFLLSLSSFSFLSVAPFVHFHPFPSVSVVVFHLLLSFLVVTVIPFCHLCHHTSSSLYFLFFLSVVLFRHVQIRNN